jgi:hypothetical protein
LSLRKFKDLRIKNHFKEKKVPKILKNYYDYSKDGINNQKLKSISAKMMKNVAQRCALDIRRATLYFVNASSSNSSTKGPKSTLILLNSENILFLRSRHARKLDKLTNFSFVDLQARVVKHIKRQNRKYDHNRCEGVYCNYKESLENALIDEKDELNNLYLMNEDEKESIKKVEYKSIILDIVEKSNTFKRLAKHTDIPMETLKKLK